MGVKKSVSPHQGSGIENTTCWIKKYDYPTRLTIANDERSFMLTSPKGGTPAVTVQYVTNVVI